MRAGVSTTRMICARLAGFGAMNLQAGNNVGERSGNGNGVRRDEDFTSWRRWALALATLATAAQLWLVWGYGFFPTVDGPAHVHLAHAFHEALRGNAFYGALVEPNPRLNPNMATQGLLVALMAVAPPFIAEKLWLTLYFVSFASAGAYALHGINRDSLCLLPLLMFCSLSLPLAFGFYNFAFSSVVFLAWFGYWWRHRNETGMRVVLAHALFACIAYGTHVFAFVVTVLAIAATGLAAIAMQAYGGAGQDGERITWRRAAETHALPPLLGSLPVLAAAAYFLLGRFGSLTSSGAANLQFDILSRLRAFLAGTSFAPYDDAEFLAAAILAPVVVAIALVLLRNRASARYALPLAVCFASFLALYALMPPQWIVRWMPPRFQPMVFIVLLLWLAALVPAALRPLHWKLVGASGLALLALSLWARMPVFERLDGYYDAFAAAAEHIKPDSTLVSIRLTNDIHGQPFPAKLDVLIQAGSRIASERHSVDLKNFQGQSEDHPIQFREGVPASALLGGDGALISLSPEIQLMAYERNTGRAIDYVVLYGFRDFTINPVGLASIETQLLRDYVLVFATPSSGFVSVYERRP
jgi:hypothetical protein